MGFVCLDQAGEEREQRLSLRLGERCEHPPRDGARRAAELGAQRNAGGRQGIGVRAAVQRVGPAQHEASRLEGS